MTPQSPFRLMTRFVTARPALAIAGLITLIVSAVAEIVFPWLLQRGIDAAVGERPGWTHEDIALSMLATIFVIAVGHSVSIYLEAKMVASGSYDLRQRIYSHIQHLPFASLIRRGSGELAYRATGDVASLETGISELLSDCTFDVLVGLGALVAMCITDVRLTLIVGAIMVFATILVGKLGDRLPSFKRASQMFSAQMAGSLQESVATARTVRAFCAEKRTISRLDAINRRLQGVAIRSGGLRAFVLPCWHFAEVLGIVVVLWYGGGLVAHHGISIGSLVGFLAYLELVSGPINRMGDYYFQFQNCRGVSRRISELLSETKETQSGASDLTSDGGVEFQHVAFQYPGTDRQIFHDLSLAIQPGEHVALCGENGAGKSTIFDLMMRFYQPTGGSVVSGGHDLSEWDPLTWRTSIGMMMQDTALVRGTLADNLAIARTNATRTEMIEALHIANADSILTKLHAGLDTVVGDRGQALSGGERQLIGLARLALRNPAIVLLDEPTAHLDGAALTTVGTAIARFVENRTMVLITHIPETLKLANRIVLLEAGQVIADGTPESMMASQPLYRSLFGEHSFAPGTQHE